jgi:hypothetical protein
MWNNHTELIVPAERQIVVGDRLSRSADQASACVNSFNGQRGFTSKA